MYICSDGHDEIVHDSRKCPFCEYISDRENEELELDMEIQELKKEIEELEEYNQKLLFFRGQKES